jgi:ribosomal-protein-alanine N-acetyltransferase
MILNSENNQELSFVSPDKLTVRLIESPDTDTIARIAALEEEAFGRGGLNEWHLPVIARHGRLYILKYGEKIIGAASLIRDWEAGRAFLFDFVIEKDARGRGYGRFLMEQLLVELKEQGIERLELTVAPDNIEAINLYKGSGFQKSAVLADEYGCGEDRWLMSLLIGSASPT